MCGDVYWHIDRWLSLACLLTFALILSTITFLSTITITLILPPQLSEEGERYTLMESESDKLLKSLRHQSDARYMYFFIQPVYPPDYSAFISKPSESAMNIIHYLISLFKRNACQWLSAMWINNPQFNFIWLFNIHLF